MNLFHAALPLLATSCLVLGLLVTVLRRRGIARRSRRGFIEMAPRYRAWLRQQGGE